MLALQRLARSGGFPARHRWSHQTAAIVDDHRRCAKTVQVELAAAGIACSHLERPTGDADFETDADIVLVSKSRVGAAEIARLPNCRLLIRMGVGFDNVDLEAAAASSITVCNIDTCTEEVADSAFSHILNYFRQTARAAIGVAAERGTVGHRERLTAERRAVRLRGKTLGIVGLGKIGQAVALRAAPFGLNVLFYDPGLDVAEDARESRSQGQAASRRARAESLHELLRESDCVSLHCTVQGSGALANREMMDEPAFAAMKTGAGLVNTARGELIDAAALAAALRDEGRGLQAHLDCVPGEPLVAGKEGWLAREGLAGVLGQGRLVLTPHCAWYSEEVEADIAREAVETCLRWQRGEPLPNALNAYHAC
jgi:phosphoglycerate dehydrogenase-like enzyme